MKKHILHISFILCLAMTLISCGQANSGTSAQAEAVEEESKVGAQDSFGGITSDFNLEPVFKNA